MLKSIQKKSKWNNTGPISPKFVEESILESEDSPLESLNSYQYSENSDSVHEVVSFLDCSVLLTLEDINLEKTTLLTGRNSISNLRESLINFQTRAAIKIQRFLRKKSLKNKLQKFFTLASTVSKSFENFNKIFSMRQISSWAILKSDSVKKIQQCWKAHKIRQQSEFPSPTRKLLAKAVLIGTKILKIDRVIEQLSPKKPANSDRNIGSLLYRKRSNVALRHHSKCCSLFSSLFSDDSDTVETISSTHISELSSYKNRWSLEVSPTDLENFHSGNGSLIMKSPFKVRTKKHKELTFEDILKNFEIDFQFSKKNKWRFIDSCIPQLVHDSKFFVNTQISAIKEKLMVEYTELIKV